MFTRAGGKPLYSYGIRWPLSWCRGFSLGWIVGAAVVFSFNSPAGAWGVPAPFPCSYHRPQSSFFATIEQQWLAWNTMLVGSPYLPVFLFIIPFPLVKHSFVRLAVCGACIARRPRLGTAIAPVIAWWTLFRCPCVPATITALPHAQQCSEQIVERCKKAAQNKSWRCQISVRATAVGIWPGCGDAPGQLGAFDVSIRCAAGFYGAVSRRPAQYLTRPNNAID